MKKYLYFISIDLTETSAVSENTYEIVDQDSEYVYYEAFGRQQRAKLNEPGFWINQERYTFFGHFDDPIKGKRKLIKFATLILSSRINLIRNQINNLK